MNMKKPKFWDNENPNIFAYLLLPITLLINFANLLRRGKKKKKEFKIKTICIGNIYIGGTGKTSLSIKLNKLLREKNIKSCFVKKYYENQKDEQKLLEKNGKLFLSKNRVEAIKQAEKENYEIAILDDGLQDNNINGPAPNNPIPRPTFRRAPWKATVRSRSAGPTPAIRPTAGSNRPITKVASAHLSSLIGRLSSSRE